MRSSQGFAIVYNIARYSPLFVFVRFFKFSNPLRFFQLRNQDFPLKILLGQLFGEVLFIILSGEVHISQISKLNELLHVSGILRSL
jgi:hypothetical protein